VIPTRTLVVWCPDWPVAAAGIAADVPAAVFQANRVVATSAAARAEGVKRGLRRREAQARCPDLVVLEYDNARDGRAFEPVAAVVESFASRVEILRPGICIVPTRGPSRYFGGDEALAAKVRQAVDAAAGHACLTGVADGPFAAVLAARAAQVVPPGESARFLATYPVSTLARPDLADILARLGIRSLGQFAALPVDDVLARFGVDGAIAHRLARGLDERPLATRNPPPDLIVQMELDPPAQRVDTAAFAGKALADELHQRLARRGLACTRVAVEAETAHGERLSRLWRHEGALTPSAIAERVRWQLDGWLTGMALAGSGAAGGRGAAGGPGSAHGPGSADDEIPDPTAGLTLLRLVPDEIVPDDGRQLGFWGGVSESGERAARSLARVQGMLGAEGVVTPVLAGGRDVAEQITLIAWGDVRQPERTPAPGAVRPFDQDEPAASAPPPPPALRPVPAGEGDASAGGLPTPEGRVRKAVRSVLLRPPARPSRPGTPARRAGPERRPPPPPPE
jgi:protein ImuB